MLLNYDEPLFRPPSEAYSLIFQITLGCSWNKCAFCEMYSSKKFSIKADNLIEKEIIEASKLYPDTKKIFLADGNAMVLNSKKMLWILGLINKSFPKVRRISAYALPNDILSKTDKELKEISNSGLKLIYVGIESGDDELLKLVNKNETFDSTVRGILKAKNAGIKSSVMILNGLGGKKYSNQHAINSAKLLNKINPEYFSTLVLSFPYGEKHFEKRFKGNYQIMNVVELLQEMKILLEHTELDKSVFRSDHASNYLVLKGILSRDKDKLLNLINNAISEPNEARLRDEWQRGL
ncbi:MAG: radical SAM protein [Bacteroidota bacterium]|nr:radical SAM protein [Bacteroidota bacterium]